MIRGRDENGCGQAGERDGRGSGWGCGEDALGADSDRRISRRGDADPAGNSGDGKGGQHPLLYLAPAGSLVLCFLFGFWVGRGVKSRFVLHGLLVGAVAMAIYLALTQLEPEPGRMSWRMR
jgi:hypothetical protein